jgi:hypothetical protein
MHTYRSPIDIQKSVFQNVDIGLSVNSPKFKEVNIIDNDIFFKNLGIYSWDVGAALQVHVEGNIPIELIPNNNPLFSRMGIQMAGQAPSVQLFDAQIINNHIHLNNNGNSGARGIDIGFTGNWFLKDNIVSYDGTNVTSSFFPGIGMISTDNSYLLHNTITGDNVGTKIRGITLGQSENCKLCCNITDDIHTGFTFHGINPDTKLRHSDIGNHTIGLDIQNGYIDDQPDITMSGLAGNRWDGAYSISAQHLGGLLDVKNSEFYVELPIGTPLWPLDPFSPAAPGQWFIQWPGNSTYCENDNTCPDYYYKAPPAPYGGPVRNFTNSEIRTASYLFENTLYGEMSKFESSRSLYTKLKESPSLLGSNTNVDQFYSTALTSDIGLLYEVDKQIADMWAVNPNTRFQIFEYEQTIDSFLTQINRIDSLISYASSNSDTLILLSQKRGFVA